jgi:NTE family protein
MTATPPQPASAALQMSAANGAEAHEAPLSSPAIGTANNDLIVECPRPGPRPAKPPDPPQKPQFALALSGGGFRATLSALGVLRFVADAGLLGRVRYSSSVSGGSIANALFARQYPVLRAASFARGALDEEIIGPFVARISGRSFKRKLLRNAWRALGPPTRTDVLAKALDAWWFHGQRLDELPADCRWIFNAANVTSGVRFGFERDVVGDWVMGRAHTAKTNLRLAQAVAASAAVPGAFATFVIKDVPLPCDHGRPARLLDGGVYDNMGLEPLDDLQDACLVAMNAGGVLQVGRLGRIPVVRDLQRSNALLYRQSTALRRRFMVDRFRAFEKARARGEPAPDWGRQGVLFSLATSMKATAEWLDGRPEHPEWREPLALVKTSFDRFPREVCDRLIYRGWWLTGATLSKYQRELLPEQLPTWESFK